MKGSVEGSEFDGALGKEGVDVGQGVPRIVVMIAGMRRRVLIVVPNPRQIVQSLRFLLVEFLQKAAVGFLAVADAVRMHLEGIVEDVLFARKGVDQIPYRLRREVFRADVDVHSRGLVYRRARSSKLADNLLQIFDVVVVKDWGYKFDLVIVSRRPAALVFGANTAVAHNRPLPARFVGNRPGVVAAVSDVGVARSEVFFQNLCGGVAANARHLNLYPDGLRFVLVDVFHCRFLLASTVAPCLWRRLVFSCAIHHSKRGESQRHSRLYKTFFDARKPRRCGIPKVYTNTIDGRLYFGGCFDGEIRQRRGDEN